MKRKFDNMLYQENDHDCYGTYFIPDIPALC